VCFIAVPILHAFLVVHIGVCSVVKNTVIIGGSGVVVHLTASGKKFVVEIKGIK
jgi:hypothetical protein